MPVTKWPINDSRPLYPEVARPGTYNIAFRVFNSSSGGIIYFETPDANNLFNGAPEEPIPATSDFTTISRTVTFATSVPKTVRLRFGDPGGGYTTYVDWLRFEPRDLMLVGPEQAPSITEFIPRGNKTHVGTVFAINTPGNIDALRFFVREEEYDLFALHTIRLRRVASSTESAGAITLTPDASFAGQTATFTPTQADVWHTIGIPQVYCTPGLYVVSVDVFADNISTSPITTFTNSAGQVVQGIALPATPSVLTLVAGSYSITPDPFANVVSYEADVYPTAYFWLDVSFTPVY